MQVRSIIIGAVAVGLAAVALPVAPAFAQTQDVGASLPSEKEVIANTGVDLRSGTYAYSRTDIASGGDGGISLERSNGKGIGGRTNPFGNFAHNWDIFIFETKRQMKDSQIYSIMGFFGQSALSSVVTVSFGGTANGFFSWADSGDYYPLAKKAHSGRLTMVGDIDSANALYTWEAEGGTKIEFRPFGDEGEGGECSASLRCAYASKVTHADGTTYTLTYDSGGSGAGKTRLRRVVSNRGYALLFEYSSASGVWFVSKSCVINLAHVELPANNTCPAGQQQTATYAYTSFNGVKLTGVTRPDATTESFAYATHSLNATAYTMDFFEPGDVAPSQSQVRSIDTNNTASGNEQSSSHIVHSQVFTDGPTYTYTWDRHQFFEINLARVQGGSFVNSEGQTARVRFGAKRLPPEYLGFPPDTPTRDQVMVWQTSQGPETITDELGRQTKFQYCEPASIRHPPQVPNAISHCEYVELPFYYTDPGGHTVFFEYDGGGNITERRTVALEGSGLPDLIETFTWSPGGCTQANMLLCGKMASATDARGNTTEFEYSTVHGNVLKRTSPPVITGGVRPQTRYGYTQRSALVKSGASYVAAATPVWLLTSEEYCRTSAADANGNCAAGASDEVVTTYEYGPTSGAANNLLLRGKVVTSQSVALRTCYAYDPFGRMISETQPNANLASCP